MSRASWSVTVQVAERALAAMPTGSHLRALQQAANRAAQTHQTIPVTDQGGRVLYQVGPDGLIHRVDS